MDIPIPKSEETDIYDLGFDKTLNRETNTNATNTVYDSLDQIQVSQITSGALSGDLVMTDGAMQSKNFVNEVSGWKIDADGNFQANSGIFRGTLQAGAIDIPNTTTVQSFHVDKNGNAWWGSTGLATGTAKVLNTGEATFKSVNITGGTVVTTILSGEVGQSNLNVANRGWSQTCIFSSGSPVYVSWATGSFITSSGTAYSISAGSTGVMGTRNYIYLDTAVATNVYQTTTVAATAVGAGKCLLATAVNNTTEASFYVFGGSGGANILGEDIALNSLTGSAIVANSITGNEIAADSITASKIDVGYLSAIAADLGTITAGNITMPNTGYLKGGQTDFNTGTGFFFGYSTDAYKQSIGSPTGQRFLWDGSAMIVAGQIKPDIVASDDLLLSADTIHETTSLSYSKVKEMTIQFGGTIRTKFDLKSSADGAGAYVAGRIYRNDVAKGTERQRNASSFATYSEDLGGWSAGDKYQLYYKVVDAGNTVYIQNFRVYGRILTGSVDTD